MSWVVNIVGTFTLKGLNVGTDEDNKKILGHRTAIFVTQVYFSNTWCISALPLPNYTSFPEVHGVPTAFWRLRAVSVLGIGTRQLQTMSTCRYKALGLLSLLIENFWGHLRRGIRPPAGAGHRISLKSSCTVHDNRQYPAFGQSLTSISSSESSSESLQHRKINQQY